MSNHDSHAPQFRGVAGQVTSDTARRVPVPGDDKTPRQYTPEERQRIERVKKLMFDLSKTVRSYSLYSQNNEAIRKFIQQLFENLTSFLEQEEVLNLRIRPETILFDDAIVYENNNIDESIATKLYKDGLKELVFQKGLEKRELVDFIDILNADLDRPEFFDEDIVSLMWERDFERISYFVIEGFSDEINDEKKEQINEDIDLILSLVHSDVPPQKGLKSAHLSKEDLYQYFSKALPDDDAQKALDEQSEFKNLFTVSEEEVRKIREELEAVTDAEMIFQMVDIIINILSKESDPASFDKIGDVLVQILDMMLLRADFTNATRIVKTLRELVISRGGSTPAKDDRLTGGEIVHKDQHYKIRLGTWIEKIIERIGEEQRLEQVVSALNQGYKGKPSEIFDYVISLNASAVNPLINLLGDISRLTQRRMICDAILIIHDGEVTKFSQKLYDDRWFVVSDMLYILGKIGDAEAVNYMMKAYEHDNPKVRMEAITALRRFPGEKVRKVFLAALRDDNLQVQLAALRALGQMKDRGASDHILEFIENPSFADVPLSTKKRFFLTLASIEGDAFVPYFKKMLSKNRFWLGPINTEMRICAAYALGVIASTKSVRILKGYQGVWNSKLKEAVRDAINRAQSGEPSDELILEPVSEPMLPKGKHPENKQGLILERVKRQ